MNEADLILGVAPTARLRITYKDQQGDLQQEVPYDLPDAEIIRIAQEALTMGIPGITADPNADLTGFMVDRFPSRDDVPFNSLSIRPKTAFGGR
jgi:hypothetical protein